jgi:PmbA protein
MADGVGDSLKPEQALDALCEETRRIGADAFDAIAGESESMGLELFEGKVKSTEISHSRGLGVRLFRGKRPGYAFTERFTRDAIAQTVRDAWSHTFLTDEADIDLPGPAALPSVDLRSIDPTLAGVGMEDMKQFCLELEERTKVIDARIDNIPYLGAGKSAGRTWIRNHKGVDFSAKGASISAGVGVTAKQGEFKKMGSYNKGGRRFTVDAGFDTGVIAQRAVERAVELLGAEPLASGEYPVVLSNRVAPQLFGMFASPFFGDAVHKGQSRLAGKLGQSIAPDFFNLTSDPHLPGWPGSHLFDSEGVVTRKLQVVEGGVLRTFLHNLESAKKDGIAPTGTGSRGYSGKAGTGFANYLVDRGTRSLEELLAAHARCFYVVKLEGGSGCSAVSGEISIGAQGFWVEQGKIIRPVDRVTLSGNFFELLPKVEAFSNAWSESFSSVKVPDTLISEMHVAG